MPRWTAFFLVLALLAACSTDSGPPTNNPPNPPTNPPTQQPDIMGNNSAVLTGVPLGSDEVDVERLRKEVPVNLATSNPDFELGTFSATRQSVDTETIYWILPITNTSNQTRCFIKAVNLTFRDGTGSTLVVDEQAFVDGGVGVLSSYTSTCLASQETGYIQGIETDRNVDVYSLLESIDIETIEANSRVPEAPATEVIPQRYNVSMNQDLSVFVENQGDQTGYVSSLSSTYTLLDAGNRPLSWGFLDLGPGWDGELTPNETRNLVDTLRYRGEAEKIKVVVDFNNESSSAEMSAQGLKGVEADLARLRQRNAVEEAKLEQLNRLQEP